MKQASAISHSHKDKHRHTKSEEAKKSKSHEAQEASHSKGQSVPKQTDSSEEKDLMEVTKKYKPISSFVDDRDELIEQLFSCITGSVLTQMIPKALKAYNTDELKKKCLQELKLMSKGLILHILQGEDPASYEEPRSKFELYKEVKKITGNEAELNSSLKRKIKEESSALTNVASSPKRCALEAIPPPTASPSKSETAPDENFLELYPTKKEMETMAQRDKKDMPPVEWGEESDLELLELEMRARAIRSLLRSRGLPSSEDDEEKQ